MAGGKFLLRSGFLFLQSYLEQVVEAPSQDDNVVDVQQRHDHNGGIANTWREERMQVEVMIRKRT